MADRGQIWAVRKDGSEFPAEASISKVEIGGELVLTVILRDTTARRDAEERMKASLREKEVLLREVHHRVKNNLQVVSSLLNLQSRGAADEYVRKGFEESQNRVQSMALIHEQLYESRDLSNVNFPEYIQQLCSRLFRSYQVEKKRVKLRTEVGRRTFGRRSRRALRIDRQRADLELAQVRVSGTAIRDDRRGDQAHAGRERSLAGG